MAGTVTRSLFDLPIIRQAVIDSFRKLTPQRQVRNPVMFVVYVGSILTTLLWVQALAGKGEAPAGFIFWVSVWLWFTGLFANLAVPSRRRSNQFSGTILGALIVRDRSRLETWQ